MNGLLVSLVCFFNECSIWFVVTDLHFVLYVANFGLYTIDSLLLVQILLNLSVVPAMLLNELNELVSAMLGPLLIDWPVCKVN